MHAREVLRFAHMGLLETTHDWPEAGANTSEKTHGGSSGAEKQKALGGESLDGPRKRWVFT